MNEIINIEVGSIVPSPENPRKKISKEELDELAQSIRSIGLLQPITVRKKIDVLDAENEVFDEHYEIVCGHRRFEAVKLAGLDTVPCIVRELTDDEAYEIMVTENLQRKDVDPFDEAEAFSLLQQRGYDVDVLASKFGKSKQYIYSRLKLRNLNDDFRSKYSEGDIDFSHCLIIARLDEVSQRRLLEERYNGGWNDLSGKPVRDLKFAITGLGVKLKDARFDTAACANCQKNLACASLFLEMEESVCTDKNCYAQKTIDVIYPKFEELRKRNPNFFIVDNYASNHLSDVADSMLLEKLRAEGFKFEKTEAWRYEVVNKGGSAHRFDISGDIVAFAFDYCYGMLGPKKEDSEPAVALKYKSDYNLDRMAIERQEMLEQYENEVLRKRVAAINERDLPAHIIPALLDRITLAYILSLTDAEGYGFSSDMDNKEVADRIATMTAYEVQSAIIGIIANDDVDTDSRFLKQMFPDYADNLKEEAERKFYDQAKQYWYNYDEVTDEMIEEDLTARIKESANQ